MEVSINDQIYELGPIVGLPAYIAVLPIFIIAICLLVISAPLWLFAIAWTMIFGNKIDL